MIDDETEEKTKKGVWNDKLEQAAQSIGQAAQAYKHMHIWQAQRATKRHKYLMGLGIIVGPLASVLQSIALALSLENEPEFSVLVIVLGFLSGIIVATVKFGKYDEGDWTSLNYWTPVFVPKGLTEEFMLKKQAEMYSRFYRRPSVILGQISKIRSLEDLLMYIRNVALGLKFILRKNSK